MVFCRACNKKVEDCEHCVYPIEVPRQPVVDAKVESLAYDAGARILEIVFRSGQVWQLSDVPEGLYRELRDSTISSFLRFLAPRYKATPVKTGLHAIRIPDHEPCATCKSAMAATHRTSADKTIRVQWTCPHARQPIPPARLRGIIL